MICSALKKVHSWVTVTASNGRFRSRCREKICYHNEKYSRAKKSQPKSSLRVYLLVVNTKGFEAFFSSNPLGFAMIRANIICLKELKRDNEYLIAKELLSGRMEPFVYVFATSHQPVFF